MYQCRITSHLYKLILVVAGHDADRTLLEKFHRAGALGEDQCQNQSRERMLIACVVKLETTNTYVNTILSVYLSIYLSPYLPTRLPTYCYLPLYLQRSTGIYHYLLSLLISTYISCTTYLTTYLPF